uniref:Uncharacterized protein n=1 Tax=Anguilla anguilla TaxID=7936 RepID=A0A0E9W126_ANGAN
MFEMHKLSRPQKEPQMNRTDTTPPAN